MMTNNVERLSVDDYEEAMDFLNYVFSFDSNPTDFPSLLPKLYQPTEKSMRCNYAIRSGGRIRAIVGLFPMNAHAGRRNLKIAGIGGVSTHPRDRGKGYMINLMAECIRTMKCEGYDLSCLGGLRQRYNHYGYETAGVSYNYTVSKDNIRYCFGKDARCDVTFAPIGESDANVISSAKGLYERQPFYCARDSDRYCSILRSWNMQPFAAFGSDGRMIGYLVSNEVKDHISEIFAVDRPALNEMIHGWVRDMPKQSLALNIPPWESETIETLGRISESVSVSASYSWMVLNWSSVIEALFEVKSLISPAADGRFRIGITGAGDFEIDVRGGSARCSSTQCEPDFVCDTLTALRLMFGPLPPCHIENLPSRLVPLLQSWFPLPLGWQHQDGI